jgi:cyclopropane fatty-acyl-phospholipid synthase-like methyltransferase
MRIALRPSNPWEWAAATLNLAPVVAAEAWGGMALSGVLVAAVRLGITDHLAGGPSTAAAVAAALHLDPPACRMILDCLHGTGHVHCRRGRYRLSRRSRRWLAPDSPFSVARFVAATDDYWPWWAGLAEVARTGQSFDHHGQAPDAPYWRRYLTGLSELARLAAPEVIARLRLPAGARTVLDIGGGHGWFAVQLCRRHAELAATVLDLPGAALVGRDLVAATGLADRVGYLAGDARVADLGGPYDQVLCFNLVHHLGADQVPALMRRAYEALAPGGRIAVLDAFTTGDPRTGGTRRPGAEAFLGLFVYLSSGATTHSVAQLHGWLREAGFDRPRQTRIRRIPGQTLHQAEKPAAEAG